MKLVEIKGKAAKPGAKAKKVATKDTEKVVQLGEGFSACFGLDRETCRQTECCRVRTICLAGWQCLFGLERR